MTRTKSQSPHKPPNAETIGDPNSLPLKSYQTALAIMLPKDLVAQVDHIRQRFDYNYQAWPTCISLLYPFTAVEDLSKAAESISAAVKRKCEKRKGHKGDEPGFLLRLDQLDCSVGRKSKGEASFICGDDPYPNDVDFWTDDADNDDYDGLPSGTRKLCILRDSLAQLFQPMHNVKSRIPRLNLGQEGGRRRPKNKTGLTDLAEDLEPIEWNVSELTLLYRVKSSDFSGSWTLIGNNQMNVWGTINLLTGDITKIAPDAIIPTQEDSPASTKLCVGQSDTSAVPTSETKLRPALDVIHRIKWDPNYDARQYGVEFSDAFHRTRCRTVSAWREDVSHQMFIPQHRVLNIFGPDYKPIWDRKRRLDLMFGSGTAMASRRLDGAEVTPKVFDSDDEDEE
ncbi:hypothetical protein KEM56_001529 [Ascosphaera pollenicola]|nr:hypothetical protein KEM56_001529 [Ascosphaera pollenicola]